MIDVRLMLGDCLLRMSQLEAGSVDAVVTDPPYLTKAAHVPIRGAGVAARVRDTESVGLPWGFSLDWIEAAARLKPAQWIVFCNYQMLGRTLVEIERFAETSAVFSWRKPNAARMTRPVPRLDCEFVIWARAPGASCKRMGEFDSLVIDSPSLPAGCFASERILAGDSGKSAHPCQKPLAVVRLFLDRMTDAGQTVIDPFMGSGTTGAACVGFGRNFIGVEKDETYFNMAQKRIHEAALQQRMTFEEAA